MSPEQLKLPYASGGYYEDWYGRLLVELGKVCTVVGLKEMSFACDSKPSTLHHALSERDERRFQARWLGPFLYKAPDLDLVTLLAEPAGVVVTKATARCAGRCCCKPSTRGRGAEAWRRAPTRIPSSPR